MKEHVNPYTWYTTHTIRNKHMSHIPTHARLNFFSDFSMDLLKHHLFYHWLQSMMILVIFAFPLIFSLILDLQCLLFTYLSINFFLWTHTFFASLNLLCLHHTNHTTHFHAVIPHPRVCMHDINHSHFLIKKEIFCFSHVCTIMALHIRAVWTI